MKQQKSVETLLTQYAETIPFPNQAHVLTRIQSSRPAAKRPSRRLVVALAVCAALVFSGTVFADQIGALLTQLQAPQLNAAQYDELIAFDGERISSSISYGGGEPMEDIGDFAKAEWVEVPTIEEAQRLMGMTFPVPTKLPLLDRLDHVVMFKYETGIYDRQVSLHFTQKTMIIELFYVGADRPADFATTSNIQPITIGEYEGIIQRGENVVELLWVQGEWLIKLLHPNEGTALRVARSMQ